MDKNFFSETSSIKDARWADKKYLEEKFKIKWIEGILVGNSTKDHASANRMVDSIKDKIVLLKKEGEMGYGVFAKAPIAKNTVIRVYAFRREAFSTAEGLEARFGRANGSYIVVIELDAC